MVSHLSQVCYIFSQWHSTPGIVGCTQSTSSSTWSLQASSEKFTKCFLKMSLRDLKLFGEQTVLWENLRLQLQQLNWWYNEQKKYVVSFWLGVATLSRYWIVAVVVATKCKFNNYNIVNQLFEISALLFCALHYPALEKIGCKENWDTSLQSIYLQYLSNISK